MHHRFIGSNSIADILGYQVRKRIFGRRTGMRPLFHLDGALDALLAKERAKRHAREKQILFLLTRTHLAGALYGNPKIRELMK
jgi:hypothetical protein